jgi:hypothetical protein
MVQPPGNVARIAALSAIAYAFDPLVAVYARQWSVASTVA